MIAAALISAFASAPAYAFNLSARAKCVAEGIKDRWVLRGSKRVGDDEFELFTDLAQWRRRILVEGADTEVTFEAAKRMKRMDRFGEELLINRIKARFRAEAEPLERRRIAALYAEWASTPDTEMLHKYELAFRLRELSKGFEEFARDPSFAERWAKEIQPWTQSNQVAGARAQRVGRLARVVGEWRTEARARKPNPGEVINKALVIRRLMVEARRWRDPVAPEIARIDAELKPTLDAYWEQLSSKYEGQWARDHSHRGVLMAEAVDADFSDYIELKLQRMGWEYSRNGTDFEIEPPRGTSMGWFASWARSPKGVRSHLHFDVAELKKMGAGGYFSASHDGGHHGIYLSMEAMTRLIIGGVETHEVNHALFEKMREQGKDSLFHSSFRRNYVSPGERRLYYAHATAEEIANKGRDLFADGVEMQRLLGQYQRLLEDPSTSPGDLEVQWNKVVTHVWSARRALSTLSEHGRDIAASRKDALEHGFTERLPITTIPQGGFKVDLVGKEFSVEVKVYSGRYATADAIARLKNGITRPEWDVLLDAVRAKLRDQISVAEQSQGMAKSLIREYYTAGFRDDYPPPRPTSVGAMGPFWQFAASLLAPRSIIAPFLDTSQAVSRPAPSEPVAQPAGAGAGR